MKICLISFDYYGFDNLIIKELKSKGIQASHIDMNTFNYKYKSFFEKIKNFFQKNLFNKNIKKIKTENFILNQLDLLGHQDIILSLRPDRISTKTHFKIKKNCNRYLCYLYDSSERFSIKKISKNIFDEIYTFDINDSYKYNFKHLTNYIYLAKRAQQSEDQNQNDLFFVSALDKRIDTINQIAKCCSLKNIKSKFIIVGKKRPKKLHPEIIFKTKKISLTELTIELESSKVFLDLIQNNQDGLSFRIFEALAFQKKIITTNNAIKKYPFYNSNNILVIEPKEIDIPLDFFNTPYQPIPEEIYNQFTIETWVSKVFGIN
ncbi:hypothetical protein [Flavobacterium sp. UMI-01]|uniref:hypothetical protein n=1 Tax=Flavobacterium sp. UMI-01 TaxID=1441053 RepID=UPI001C7E1367|nr:hypothetical protein [Flavobacterium sp. UMI-01]GIZ08724.1 hypothetical protein FUMI01_14510 [Flavobacterium sp. UMI-01]